MKKFKKKESSEKNSEIKMRSNKVSTSVSQSMGTFFKSLLLIMILSGIAVMMVGSFMLVKIISDAPTLDLSSINAIGSSTVYDMNGDLIADLSTQRQEWVTFDEISPVMIDAIIATEDSRFFEHHGVDWNRFLAASISNLTNFLGLTHGLDQGGSTITQQLVKQTHFTSEDDRFIRKLQEIYLSIQLERQLSKEQILEAYLNYSPFGGNISGIQAAAEYYFGTNASDLTLAEAATLAGLVQAPNAWRPDHFADSTETRRDIVLRLMVNHGYITDEMATLAAAQPITDKLVLQETETDSRELYQSFLDVVFNEVENRFGLTVHDGLQIFTTMDPDAQAFVHNLQNGDILTWPTDMQSGIVFMETQTGRVRAIGGGAADTERSFNLATQARRQIGSTAKPIFAYGAAIEYLGWGSGTILNDELYSYPSGQIINNHNREYHGRMTIREALDQSWNVPAVKGFNHVVNGVGEEKLAEFISRLGFEISANQLLPSTALGTFEATSLQMAAAYAAFGNGGIYNEPMFIEKIITADGTVYYGEELQTSERAMSEETAYIMTQMLHSVMVNGTGTLGANVGGQWLAGKTGTTNMPAEIIEQFPNMPANAMRDSWFIGYSMNYTASIWTGYTDTSQGHFIDGTSQRFSWLAFNRIMQNLNTSGTAQPTRPDTIVTRTVETISGDDGTALLASSSTPNAFRQNEFFRAGTEPTTVSTRFQQLAAPRNFTADISGTSLSFRWDRVEGHTMSLSAATSAFNSARSARQGQTFMNDRLRNLSPTEAEARMMMRQIEAIGETVYTVFATTTGGSTVALGTTSDNSINIEVTLGQLAQYTEFFVRASFSNFDALASERSNVVANDLSITTVDVQDMTNWTRSMVENWASENGVTAVFEEEASEIIQADLVIRTSPSDTIPVGGTLVVVISTGPEMIETPEDPEDTPPTEEDPGTENNEGTENNQGTEGNGNGYEPTEPDVPASDTPVPEGNDDDPIQPLIGSDGFPTLSFIRPLRNLLWN